MGITDSPAKLAIIFIVGGVVLVFALMGSSLGNIFAPGTTEQVVVSIKQGNSCIVEASDGIPRQISNCPYEQGETISITYKQGQPAIQSHSPVQS